MLLSESESPSMFLLFMAKLWNPSACREEHQRKVLLGLVWIQGTPNYRRFNGLKYNTKLMH
jgi:hypothetical protein